MDALLDGMYSVYDTPHPAPTAMHQRRRITSRLTPPHTCTPSLQVHGPGPGGVYAFGVHPAQPGGVDASITVIELTLLSLLAAGAIFGAQCILKIQADNCYDNKSTVMYMYLAYLVHLNIFPEVSVGLECCPRAP